MLSVAANQDSAIMATGGRSRQQYVLTDVKDPNPSPSTYTVASPDQQMHRSHHYADSLYFIQKRYEDTSLVIFHQNSKAKRKESKADQHPQWSIAATHNPQHHLQLPPAVGYNPVKSKKNSVSIDESQWGAASSVPSSPHLSADHTTSPSSLGGHSTSSAESPGKGSSTFFPDQAESEKSDIATPASSPRNHNRFGSSSSVDPSSTPRHQESSPPSSPNQVPADLATNGEVPEFESTRL